MRGKVVDRTLNRFSPAKRQKMLGQQLVFQRIRMIKVKFLPLGKWKVRKIGVIGVESKARGVPRQHSSQARRNRSFARAGRAGNTDADGPLWNFVRQSYSSDAAIRGTNDLSSATNWPRTCCPIS